MQAQLRRNDLSEEDRFHFHFSLGKAFEDAGDYAKSFEHYEQGNRLRREMVQYEAEETSEQMRRSKQLLTSEFFAAREGWGSSAPDPIFIVGLPRAGSTLLEQILSSHPLVEGTMELPDIIDMARSLGGGRARGEASKYPEVLAELSADQLRELGDQYIANTRIQRKTDAPFFIDKMPNNFAHVGLIQLMLPHAKIIDARRHPLGCCFSGFKQHFARGQHFTYGLDDIGRYYRDYVELMAHFDAVLPGRVHRVIYETLVDDTEREVRRLLDYCGLPFDERCLRFYENDRAVRTASSEQVRRPIYRDGVDHWQHYESWLEPLKRALGPVLESYPAVPEMLLHSILDYQRTAWTRGYNMGRARWLIVACMLTNFGTVAEDRYRFHWPPPCLATLSHGASAQSNEGAVLESIIVTAQKRPENLQEVPLSITALGTAKLEELHVTDFDDYAKFLPSLSYTSLGPGFSRVFFRGVSSGDNGNHSGSMPSVGIYLDEQPITTIQGALDVHVYDIARVEALAGPQGTLYGASSQAGTIRIITNKPDPTKFAAGYDIEGNSLDGEAGYVAEGFANLPLGEKTAIRSGRLGQA